MNGLRTVGVIGGMGPLATAAFLRLLVLNSSAGRDQDHLHVLVDSEPSIPDRTAFLLGSGEDPRPALARSALRLRDAGADLLVMPCNTANVFADEIERAAGIPLVPWLDTAVKAVCAATSASDVRCGVLATSGTLQVGRYATLLQERGAIALEPGKQQQADVMAAIYGPAGVKATGRLDGPARDGLLGAARDLVSRGANVLLLACTELPLGIPADDRAWPVPAVDPAVEVARRTIVAAGGRLTESVATA